MPKILLRICLVFAWLFSAGKVTAQVFWTETFSNGCASLCTVSSYSGGPNGPWTLSSTGTNDTHANQWYVSGSECGFNAGVCGNGCGTTDPSLHVGNVPSSPNAFFFCPTGDCGAAYDAGWGTNRVRTSRRAESPIIDCSGRTGIRISFNYIENGEGSSDNASLWYFDGSTWSQIADMAKSNNSGCSGQGRWTAFSMNLPASANNNPNVKIGFNWVNNDNGSGSDPSFAVDDIQLDVLVPNTLLTVSVSPNRICAGGTATVSFSGTGTLGAGNVYTVQLSDASGSFASPLVLGSLSSLANSGTITATIPAGLVSGNAYLLRVVSSNPVTIASTSVQLAIVELPQSPTLSPQPVCEGSIPQFTAGNGSLYAFYLDGTPQGEMSSSGNYSPESPLAANAEVCVRSYPPMPFTFNGLLNEPEWGIPLATSTGGPSTSGFGIGNNMDALYLSNGYGYLFGGIAGALINQTKPDKILLFIDCKAGGFNNLSAWTARLNTPYSSLKNLNSSITFDSGFEPDYVLCINGNYGDVYFDLYDMLLDVNTYLGSDNTSTELGYSANAGVGDFTKGFEFAIPLGSLGNPTGTMQFFAMMVNEPELTDSTFLSNQFLTRANNGEGNYADGFVDFNAAAPNPIAYTMQELCYKETCQIVSEVQTPVFSPIGPFCEGELLPPGPLLPDVSDNGLSGSWSGIPSTDQAGVFEFTFTPDDPCANTTSIQITIKEKPITTSIFHD